MLLWKKKKILWHSFEIFIFKKREKSLFCRHFCKHCFSYSSVIPAKCFVSTISVAKHSRLIINELSLRKISGARKHCGVNDRGINRHRKLLMLNAGICTSLLYQGAWRVRVPRKPDVLAFWSWNLDAVVFRPWNLDVVAFCPLKKCLGITMSWVNCLRFPMSRFFGLGISMSWDRGVVDRGPHGLVFVFAESIMPHIYVNMWVVN